MTDSSTQASSAAWLQANRPDLVNAPATTPEQAAAINTGYLQNTLPVKPAFVPPVGYDDKIIAYDTTGIQDPANQLGKIQYVSASQDAVNEYDKYMRLNHPEQYYGAPDRSTLGGMSKGQIASRYGVEMAEATGDYFRARPTAEYNALISQYEQQQNRTIGTNGIMQQRAPAAKNPYDPNTALGIAWEVSKTGGVDTNMLGIAGGQAAYYGVNTDFFNYAVVGSNNKRYNVTASEIDNLPTGVNYKLVTGMDTEPTRPKGSGEAAGMPTTTTLNDVNDVYMAVGGYQGVRVPGAKIAIDYATGEFGVYAPVAPGRKLYNLIGGGGLAAAQSGMFSVGESLWDPAHTFELSDIGKMRPVSSEYMATHSKAGAEAYAGFSRPLDNRTLDSKDIISRYGNTGNLANYVQQIPADKGVNPAKIPWEVASTAPAAQYMDQTGLTGKRIDVLSGTKPVATVPLSSITNIGVSGPPIIKAPAKEGALVAGVSSPTLSEFDTEYKPSGFLGLGGMLPEMPDAAHVSAYVTDLTSKIRANPIMAPATVGVEAYKAPVSVISGVASTFTMGATDLLYKPEPIVVTGATKQTGGGSYTVNMPTSTSISGGNQTITALGTWLDQNAGKIDRYDSKAVADYNSKVDQFMAMQAQNPTVITTKGGTMTTTTGQFNTPQKIYANEWERYVEGSGRVARWITGLSLSKQAAYYETIKNQEGLGGEVKRGLYFAETEGINKPAELPIAAASAALFMEGLGVAGGAANYLSYGGGLTGKVAGYAVSPTGSKLLSAGLGIGLTGLYGYGVTEGGTATAEKTKENIYRSAPSLVAMYAGGGGLDWIPKTELVRGRFSEGTTFTGVSVDRNVFYGVGKSPEGANYFGAFEISNPREFYGIMGKPPVARAGEIPTPDMGRPGPSGPRAGLPFEPTPTTSAHAPASPGGMYATPESIYRGNWVTNFEETYVPGYRPTMQERLMLPDLSNQQRAPTPPAMSMDLELFRQPVETTLYKLEPVGGKFNEHLFTDNVREIVATGEPGRILSVKIPREEATKYSTGFEIGTHNPFSERGNQYLLPETIAGGAKTYVADTKAIVTESGISWNTGKTGLPLWDSYIGNKAHGVPAADMQYEASLTWMHPQDYISTQIEIFGMNKIPGRTGRELFYHGLEENNVAQITAGMYGGDVFSALAIERNRFGGLENFQEGRHRSVAALRAGAQRIPVWEIYEKEILRPGMPQPAGLNLELGDYFLRPEAQAVIASRPTFEMGQHPYNKMPAVHAPSELYSPDYSIALTKSEANAMLPDWQTDSPFVKDKLTFIEIHGKDTLPAHLSKTIPETEYGFLSEMAKEQGHHKLFAISEGKIVGGVSYGYMELGDTFGGERYLEMYSMEAVPRGSGVGTAIVNKIEQIAMSKNVKAIEGASLETAIGFWKKMGYEHPSENKFAMYDIRKPIMQEPEPYNKMPALPEVRTPFRGWDSIGSEGFVPFEPVPAREMTLSKKVAAIDRPISAADIYGSKESKLASVMQPLQNLQNREMEAIINPFGEPVAHIYGLQHTIPLEHEIPLTSAILRSGTPNLEDWYALHTHPVAAHSMAANYPSINDVTHSAYHPWTEGVAGQYGIVTYRIPHEHPRGKSLSERIDTADWYKTVLNESGKIASSLNEKYVAGFEVFKTTTKQYGVETNRFSYPNPLYSRPKYPWESGYEGTPVVTQPLNVEVIDRTSPYMKNVWKPGMRPTGAPEELYPEKPRELPWAAQIEADYMEFLHTGKPMPERSRAKAMGWAAQIEADYMESLRTGKPMKERQRERDLPWAEAIEIDFIAGLKAKGEFPIRAEPSYKMVDITADIDNMVGFIPKVETPESSKKVPYAERTREQDDLLKRINNLNPQGMSGLSTLTGSDKPAASPTRGGEIVPYRGGKAGMNVVDMSGLSGMSAAGVSALTGTRSKRETAIATGNIAGIDARAIAGLGTLAANRPKVEHVSNLDQMFSVVPFYNTKYDMSQKSKIDTGISAIGGVDTHIRNVPGKFSITDITGIEKTQTGEKIVPYKIDNPFIDTTPKEETKTWPDKTKITTPFQIDFPNIRPVPPLTPLGGDGRASGGGGGGGGRDALGMFSEFMQIKSTRQVAFATANRFMFGGKTQKVNKQRRRYT